MYEKRLQKKIIFETYRAVGMYSRVSLSDRADLEKVGKREGQRILNSTEGKATWCLPQKAPKSLDIQLLPPLCCCMLMWQLLPIPS
jgi:hypothetical protein